MTRRERNNVIRECIAEIDALFERNLPVNENDCEVFAAITLMLIRMTRRKSQ